MQAQLRPTLERLCQRLRVLGLLGTMSRRATKLGATCARFVNDKQWVSRLLHHAAELSIAAKAASVTPPLFMSGAGQGSSTYRNTCIPAAGPAVDDLCAEKCSSGDVDIGRVTGGAFLCNANCPNFKAIRQHRRLLSPNVLLALAFDSYKYLSNTM